MNENSNDSEILSPQERLATIEKLAGEVSHTFNNQLTGLMGFANLIRMRSESENIKKYASEILSICKASSEMMKEFLLFARNRSSVNAALVSLNTSPSQNAQCEKNGDAQCEKNSGTILLVDDDDGIRDSVSAYLRNIGYSVFTAIDGVDAVEKYGETYGAIDIVIFDMVMPRMTGIDAFEKMKEINPNIKAICITGFNTYTDEEITSKGVLQILHKPFQFDDLKEAISRHIKTR